MAPFVVEQDWGTGDGAGQHSRPVRRGTREISCRKMGGSGIYRPGFPSSVRESRRYAMRHFLSDERRSSLRQRRKGNSLGMVGFLAAIVGGAVGLSPASAQVGSDTTPAEMPCEIGQISQQRLTLDGQYELYVEPAGMAASGEGDVLLVGSPNYLFKGSRADGSGYRTVRDSLFGVVISMNGRARSVPAPMDPRLIQGIRVLTRRTGGWEAVFAETRPWTEFPPPETAERLWYGVYSDGKWQRLEEIPVPEGRRALTAGSSNLVQHGDTIMWAVRMTRGAGGSEEVGLLGRTLEGWSQEIIPTPAAYVQLSNSKTRGLIVAAVAAFTGDHHRNDSNSLLFYTRERPRGISEQVVRGGVEPIHQPFVALSGDPDVITWWSAVKDSAAGRREARALIGDVEHGNTQLLVIDSMVEQVIPIQASQPRVFWITSHIVGDRPAEIHVIEWTPAGASLLTQFPNPFTGPFNAVSRGSGLITVAGPQLDRTGDRPPLVTLTLDIEVSCPAARSGR